MGTSEDGSIKDAGESNQTGSGFLLASFFMQVWRFLFKYENNPFLVARTTIRKDVENEERSKFRRKADDDGGWTEDTGYPY